MKYLLCALMYVLYLTSNAYSQNTYSIDIPDPERLYAHQEQSNWCWAACNQMLLKSKGIDITQASQVQKLFGSLINQGAGPTYERAKLALAGQYKDDNDEMVMITPYISYLGTHSDDPLVIISQLERGIPVMMATRGHGRICIGVDYIKSGNLYQITTVRLLNPNTTSDIESFALWQLQQMEGGLLGFMTINVK